MSDVKVGETIFLGNDKYATCVVDNGIGCYNCAYLDTTCKSNCHSCSRKDHKDVYFPYASDEDIEKYKQENK